VSFLFFTVERLFFVDCGIMEDVYIREHMGGRLAPVSFLCEARKGGDARVTVYESLTFAISFATLIIAVLSFDQKK
jgi:hypothetical protein